MAAAFSVVVPAHNEAAVIGRCLDAFVTSLHGGEAEVVVVVNGSTDATAQIASSYPGVTVIETATAGKAHALNLGDAAATSFPRVYLDADIVVSADALRELAGSLPPDRPALAGLRFSVRTAESTLPVRMFYSAFLQMPYAEDSLAGFGLYALSAAGRARFDSFPDLQGDDLFVQRLFGGAEAHRVDRLLVVEAPRDLRSLVRVRTRIHRGNAQATETFGLERFHSTTTSSIGALLRVVHQQPRRVLDVGVYVLVTVLARRAARAVRHSGNSVWQRDESTR